MISKLRRIRSAVLLAAALCVSANVRASIHPEAGNFIFQNYESKTYGASPQNWAVLQDQRGVMYFGNTEGLLEFDGVQWRRIALPNGGAVRSLGMDDSGTVYVGGQGDFGFLEPDDHGNAKFVSLLELLNAEERKLVDVRSIVISREGVFFSATRAIIRYRPRGSVKLWKSATTLGRAFLMNGGIHAVLTGEGLHRLEDSGFKLIPGGERFLKFDIRGVLHDSKGPLIVSQQGFFRKTEAGFEESPSAASALLKNNNIYSALQLPDGTIALGTTRGGLILLNPNGSVARALTKESGLPSDYIAAISTDRQGGIWLATGNGLVRFDLGLTGFDERNGLRGSVISLARWQGTLYAGTTSGLYRLKPPATGKITSFEAVPGIQQMVVVLLASDDGLWIGGQQGLYLLRGAKPEQVLATNVIYDVVPSMRDRGVLYAVGSGAFALQKTGGKWQKVSEMPAAGQELRNLAIDSDGLLWITTRTDILRVDFSSSPPKAERFGEADGLPKGWKSAFRAGGRLVFATEKGLLKYSTWSHRFEPDPSLSDEFSDGSRGILLIREDPNQNLWITGFGYHGILEKAPNGKWNWKPMPLLRAGLEELYAIQTDTDGIAWAAGADGRLMRYEPVAQVLDKREFRVLMRRVLSPESKSPLFGGLGTAPALGQLPYSQNDLRVEFAAPFYDSPRKVEYQVLVDGISSGWSAWTMETWKDLNNLWEGAYRVRVRARSPYGVVSPEATLSFRVAPPWYRTWWALTLYLSAAGGLIWLLVRWRLQKLVESNRRLEALVYERTVEIRRQRDQIQEEEKKTEGLLLNILPAPVASELRHTGSVVPMHFDDVTVCFTDLVGFTISSEKMAAQELVARLHEYFTEFDKIIGRYGLEKLKTIGDAYMFVSGLPEKQPSHAVDAALAAMEILAKSKELARKPGGVPWKLRVGLHSGPVVAGVVGVRKFAFDIWGNTVNLASRMESSGSPDRVNMSAATFPLVKEFLDCESRGLVRTKDGRDLEMYFANGLRPGLINRNGHGAEAEAYIRQYEAKFGRAPKTLPAQSIEEVRPAGTAP